MAQDPKTTLFARIGGQDAVNAAVKIFYDKVLKDPELEKFFVGVDIPRLRTKQRLFISYAFGGLPDYPGESLRECHKPLVEKKGLGDVHFDKVAGHFVATLKELKVSESLIAEAVAIVSSTRKDVLNR